MQEAIDNNRPQSPMRRSFLKCLSSAILYGAADIDAKPAILEKVFPDTQPIPGTLDTWYPRSFFNAIKLRGKLIPDFIGTIQEDAALLNAGNLAQVLPSGFASYRQEAENIARFISKSINDYLNDSFCLNGIPADLASDPAFKQFAAKTIAEGQEGIWLRPFTSEKQLLAETKRLYAMKDNPKLLEAEIMQRLEPVLKRIEKLTDKIEEVKKHETTHVTYSVKKGKFTIKAEAPSQSESWREKVACKMAGYTLSRQELDTVRHLALSRDPSLWVEQANWAPLKGPALSDKEAAARVLETPPKPRIAIATPDMVVDESGLFRPKTETRRLSFSSPAGAQR